MSLMGPLGNGFWAVLFKIFVNLTSDLFHSYKRIETRTTWDSITNISWAHTNEPGCVSTVSPEVFSAAPRSSLFSADPVYRYGN